MLVDRPALAQDTADPPIADDAKQESPADPKAQQPPDGKVPKSLIMLGRGKYYSPYAFVVDKSRRTLSIWYNSENVVSLVSAFPTDMGKRDGDKTKRGDHKTPEGVYFFQKRLEGPGLDFSQYGIRAFTMDYPNFFDKRERKTGDGIWLHAIPDTETLKRGSRGCVVVRNEVIDKLTPYVTLKQTPIIVDKEVEYIDINEFKQARADVGRLLNNWRHAWQTENIDNYMKFYSENFRAMRMNKSAWRAYKAAINAKYDSIEIEFKNPVAYTQNDEIVVRFLQVYRSNLFNDFGEKKLYLKKDTDGELRIVGEEWSAVDNSLLAGPLPSSSESNL